MRPAHPPFIIGPELGMKLKSLVFLGSSLIAVQAAWAQQDASQPVVLDTITLQAGLGLGGLKGDTFALDSSVVGKSEVPLIETPRAVSVVTEQRMADQGVRTVQDALVYSAGVYGAAYGFDTRGDWSKVRGLEPEEYRDGLKRSAGWYNDTRPHPYMLEQIEILKGPGAVTYGAGSPSGTLNIVSKLPQEEPRREMFVEYGSHNWRQVGVDVTGSLDARGTLLYRLVGVWRDSDSQVDHVPDNARALAPSLTWRPTDDTDLTVMLNFQRGETGTSTQFLPWAGTILPGPNGQIPPNRFLSEPGWDRYDTEQKAVTAIFNHRFNTAWSVSARARFSDGRAEYDTMYPTFPPTINPDGRTVDRIAYMSDASARIFAADLRVNGEFSTGAVAHRLAFGIDHQRATTENDYYFGSGGTIDVYDPVYGNLPTDLPYFEGDPATTRQTGLYLQDQLKFGNGWIASLGLRHDNAEDASGRTDRVWSKDVGVLYDFGNGLASYASYSESFQPITETDQDGNPYKPERGKQYEIGVKYQPQDMAAFYTASIFQIEKQNLLVNDLSNPRRARQIGEVEIKGIELEAQTVVGQVELLANYSWLDTESDTGFRLETVPDHLVSAWATWRPEGEWQGVKAGLGLRYVGRTWDGVDQISTDPYLLADAMLGYETEDWSLTLNLRNLTDEIHLTACLARGDCFYGDRRSVALNLTSRF